MYKESSSPAEVKLAVASDWHDHDVTYMDAALMTGYKYPTICNIMANKKAYFTPRQAERLREAYGYSLEYLILGKGTLKAEEKPQAAADGRNGFMSDDYKVTFLLKCIKDIGEAKDDELLQYVYLKFMKAITTDDPKECAENVFDISERIVMMQVAEGKPVNEIEAARIPSNLWESLDMNPPKDDDI